MMAEVAKAEAEVEKLNAEVAKLYAEASQEEGGMNAPKIQVQMEALENKLAIARENVRLRVQLAQFQSQQNYEKQVIDTQSKLITDSNNNDARLEQERMRQLGQAAMARLNRQSPTNR